MASWSSYNFIHHLILVWFSWDYVFTVDYWQSIRESWHIKIYIYICTYSNLSVFTFIGHDCHLHTCPLQATESLSLLTVLLVTEVEARDEDAQPQVGHLRHEARKAMGTVWTGWPGTEPGDGISHPDTIHTGTQETWAQYPKIAQEEKLKGGKKGWYALVTVVNIYFHLIIVISNTNRIMYPQIHTWGLFWWQMYW